MFEPLRMGWVARAVMLVQSGVLILVSWEFYRAIDRLKQADKLLREGVEIMESLKRSNEMLTEQDRRWNEEFNKWKPVLAEAKRALEHCK